MKLASFYQTKSYFAYLVALLAYASTACAGTHAAGNIDATSSSVATSDDFGITSFKIHTFFSEGSYSFFCLGTLIQRRQELNQCEYAVATAAHCLSEDFFGAFHKRLLASQVEIDRFGKIDVFDIQVHPRWASRESKQAFSDGFDAGIIRFRHSCVIHETEVVPIWRAPWQPSQKMHLASINEHQLLSAIADEPRLSKPTRVRPSGDVEPKHFIRHGDSGGGCFIQNGNRLYLAGIISHGKVIKGRLESYCSSQESVDWIAKNIEQIE